MKTIAVNLPDELAAFVESAVASGAWPTADRLFADALLLARTRAMLGRTSDSEEPPKPKSGTLPAVDLTRQNFDCAAFVAGLVDKIQRNKPTPPGSGKN